MALTNMPVAPYKYNQHFVAMMNVINFSRLNPPNEGQRHHIIPKCWFNMNNLPIDNSPENLVLLSFEDHIKVHKLSMLCAATAQMRSKMAFAVKRLLRGNFSGMHHTEESNRKNSEAHKGKKASEDTLRRMSEAMKGEKNSFYGKHHSEESLRKMSKSLKGKRKGMTWKIVEGHRVWYKKEVV